MSSLRCIGLNACRLPPLSRSPQPPAFHRNSPSVLLRKGQEAFPSPLQLSRHGAIILILPSFHLYLSTFIPDPLPSHFLWQLPQLFLFFLESPDSHFPTRSFPLGFKCHSEVSSGLRGLSLLGLPSASVFSLLFLCQACCSCWYLNARFSFSVSCLTHHILLLCSR